MVTKNEQISKTMAETHKRHSEMVCRVYECKVVNKKLKKSTKEYLNKLFLESKWVYNHILANSDKLDVFHLNYKDFYTVQRMDKDKNLFDYEISCLNTSLLQTVVQSVGKNIFNLSKVKKNKRGKLRFKQEVNTIVYRQNNNTHKIINKSFIKLTGVKEYIRVRGLNQIKPDMDVTEARLVKRPDGLYFLITTFAPREEKVMKNHDIGLDFGIKTAITTSDGVKYEKIFVKESERLKRLQTRLNRHMKKTRSNNRNKLLNLINIEYQKMNNKKKDISNKIVHDILSTADTIYMQDEMIKGWHKNKCYSKIIQHSYLGMIKAKLCQNSNVVLIDKRYATTKICYKCGKSNNISLNERTYRCDCGLVEDRDIKAAKTILSIGKKILVPTERRDFKPVESNTSGDKDMNISKTKYCSMKQEASIL